MKYSRIIFLLTASIACVGVNFWLITTGHYRWPLFVFLGTIALVALVLPKLPPVTRDPQQILTNQQKAAVGFRRLGFLYVIGIVLGLARLWGGEFKDLPVSAVVFAFCWTGFLIWGCFWTARKYKQQIGRNDKIPSTDKKI